MSRRRSSHGSRYAGKPQRYRTAATGETFVRTRPSYRVDRSQDHGPRPEAFTQEHTCTDCASTIEGMERCYVATVEGTRRFWHWGCLPGKVEPW